MKLFGLEVNVQESTEAKELGSILAIQPFTEAEQYYADVLRSEYESGKLTYKEYSKVIAKYAEKCHLLVSIGG